MKGTRTHTWDVRTPEGVAFSFRLASPVLRASAFLIDWAVVMAGWSVISVVFSLLQLLSADIAGLLMMLSYFVLTQGYTIFAEWRWQGQTFGKRLLRLRVVDADGLPLTFSQVVLRNVLRFVDGLPLFYLVGGAAAVVSSRSQRLGDLAANTLVIWEPVQRAPDVSRLGPQKYNSLRLNPAAVARLRQTVGPVEARAAWLALLRRDRLEPTARADLLEKLAVHFATVGAVPPALVDEVAPEQFVRNVVEVLYTSR